MKRWVVCGLIGLTAACAQKKFEGTAKAKDSALADEANKNPNGSGSGQDPNGDNGIGVGAFSDILDVAELPKNSELRAMPGVPTAGEMGKIEQTLDLSCEQTPEFTATVGPEGFVKVPAQTKALVNIKGRFCPTISSNLTVLFIIDFSGSMGPGDPDPNGNATVPATGNDPRIMVGTQATCGRLLAVEAILNKFAPTDRVNVGVVTFAGGLIESHTAAPQNQATFKSTRLADAARLTNFCSYIAPTKYQTNPAALVLNPPVEGGTNYEAAFQRAAQYLNGLRGRKAVYFITDGRPTGMGDPVASAKLAAAELKKVENLYFNAFFLQNKQAGLPEDTVGLNTLIDIAGSKDRVVKADSAQQLAIEVGKEQTVQIDPASIQATLTINPYKPQEPLKIISFQQDPNNSKAWVFETQGFALDGLDQEAVTHLIEVSAVTLDKTKLSSKVKLVYDKNP